MRQFVPRRREASVGDLFPPSFFSQDPLPPFDDLALEFLAELSKRLMRGEARRRFAELVALAYFLRPANLKGFIAQFHEGVGPDAVVVPRGVAFHVAPSNVDSIFMYSWALALLAGNTNVVRISQEISEQMDALLTAIAELVAEDRWRGVAARNVVLTYPHDEATSAWLSQRADVRLIWGGDRTIETIRALPAGPTVKDVAFADKFSYTVVDGGALLEAGEPEVAEVAQAFYNDAYWFDQMACSSPRLVYFVGEETACRTASERWWGALDAELARRGHEDEMPVAMEKLVFLHERAAQGLAFAPRARLLATKPEVLRVGSADLIACRETCGGGVFFECFLPRLDDLVALVQPNDQTLTYFGFPKETLATLVRRIAGRGIDRVVPVGRALDFSPVWDGYVLLDELTRRVTVL